MFALSEVQAALRAASLDGWLLYDFRGSNVLARRILDMGERPIGSRRFFYYIPAEGEPAGLVHRIESGVLDHLPGPKRVYLHWKELDEGVARLLAGARRVAMEYAPRNRNPYVSRVDAGTVELVRELGVEVVSSGDLVQRFEAAWDDEQWAMHLEAARHTTSAFDRAFGFIARELAAGRRVRESAVQAEILAHFHEHGLVTDHPPIVAVGRHSADPHYATTPTSDVEMAEGDLLLIDLWAKLERPRSVYSDLTRMGYLGKRVPETYQQVFSIVAAARDAAISCVREAYRAGHPLPGWKVDQAARDVIEAAGYGPQFVHRTGHSIGQETHGNGANMDNLETHEERLVLPRTCFSIEPGIYLTDFGIRSEVNVFVDGQGDVHVTGGPLQTEILAVLG